VRGNSRRKKFGGTARVTRGAVRTTVGAGTVDAGRGVLLARIVKMGGIVQVGVGAPSYYTTDFRALRTSTYSCAVIESDYQSGSFPLDRAPTSGYSLKVSGGDIMTIKLADSKGRIMLGSEYANLMIIVDDSTPGQIVLKPAKAVPLADAWLYENKKALALVRTGLEQAQTGRFSETPPDLVADAKLAEAIED
jgi:hypothetical protein